MSRVVSESDVASEPVAGERSVGLDTLNVVGRFVAAVAAGVLTVIALIALAKFDWGTTGMDSPAVTVAGMSFRPWIAIVAAVLGLLALAAAVSWDRESKLFMGAVLVAIGVAILVANPTLEGVVLEDRMGWLAIIVGGVLALVGLIAGQTWNSRRLTHTHGATVA